MKPILIFITLMVILFLMSCLALSFYHGFTDAELEVLRDIDLRDCDIKQASSDLIHELQGNSITHYEIDDTLHLNKYTRSTYEHTITISGVAHDYCSD